MPFGAGSENIGQAWVDVHANGDAVRVGINDSFDGLEDDLERRGREGGEAYRRGWGEELDIFRRDLAHSLDENLTDFGRGLDRNRIQLTGAESRVERLRLALHDLSTTTARHRAIVDDFTRSVRESSDYVGRHRVEIEDLITTEENHRSILDRLRTSMSGLGRDTDRTGQRFGFLRESLDGFINIVRSGTGNKPALIRTMERMGDEGDRNSRVFGRLNNHVDRFANIVGRGFGRGSRNNFLNFMGSMAGGFVRLIGIIPKAIDLVTTFGGELFKKMSKAAADAGGGIEGFGAAMVALGEEFVVFGPLAIGFIAVLAAMVLVIGPLISLMSGLAAAVVALAASLAFAVVGALAPLLGLIAPLGIGVGVLAAAFLGLNDAAKKALKEAVKPLKEELGKLGDIARKPILDAITENAKKLVPLFQNLRPLVQRVSEAFGGLIDDFGKAADNKGSGLNKFIDRMTKFAPNAIDKLGTSLGNFLSGFLGVFRSLTGPVNDFLGWLQEITDEFDNWANSVKGQRELKKFFDDASDSASKLWGLLGSIGGLLSTLFNAGRGTGDSIIDTMTKKVEEFNQFLKDNPDRLDKWFQFGQDTVGQLGDIAVSLGEIADTLDDDTSRSELLTTLESIGKAVGAIDNVIEVVQILIDLLTGSHHSDFISGLTEGAENAGNAIREKIGGALSAIGDSFRSLGGGSGAMTVGTFTGWIPGAVTALEGFRSRVLEFFSGLGGKIEDAIGKVNVFKNFDFPSFGSITSHFHGLGGSILKAIAHIHLFDNVDFPSFGSITSHFRGLGSAILKAIAHIHLFDNIDFPSFGSVTSHFSGLGKAILKALGHIHLFDNIDFPSFSSITSHFSGLGAAIVRAIGSIDIFPTVHWPDLTPGGGGAPSHPPNNPAPGNPHPGDGTLTASGLIGGTGATGNSRVFNNVFHITSPNDPRAVANEFLNQLVATGY